MTTATKDFFGGLAVIAVLLAFATFLGFMTYKTSQPFDAKWVCSGSDYDALLRCVRDGTLTEADIPARA